ncbi:MAG: hypothetical protein KDJ17_06075 [Hyphomicrobiaceae bacterium]|nr:hypothetical protein [Hyphomicrobiaceae bacterium]
MYILFNALMMVLELAAIVAIAWAGFTYPLGFAAGTAAIAFILGMRLEYARLQNEIPFYFDRAPGRAAVLAWIVASGEAFAKALLAGIVGLLTFLGTDPERLMQVAGIFAFTLFLGVQIVRWLTSTLKARPLRWGYFRLAAPLGIVFSVGQSFLAAPGFSELARQATFEMPAHPTMEQASEFLFLLKQTFDDIVERMLTWVFDPAVAQIAASLVSVNMLSGFVLSIYAVLIAEGIRRMEQSNV